MSLLEMVDWRCAVGGIEVAQINKQLIADAQTLFCCRHIDDVTSATSVASPQRIGGDGIESRLMQERQGDK